MAITPLKKVLPLDPDPALKTAKDNIIVRSGHLNPVIEAVNELLDGNANMDNLDLTGTLNVDGISTLTGGINTGSGTQVGSDSPTINKPSGIITTAVTATVPQAYKTVTLTNSFVTTSSKVFVSLSGYGGTGIPVIAQVTPGSGSVVIKVLNSEDTGGANLSAAMDLLFLVIN